MTSVAPGGGWRLLAPPSCAIETWNKPSSGALPSPEVMAAHSWPNPHSAPLTLGATATSSISSQKRNGVGNTSTNGGFSQAPAPLVDRSPKTQPLKVIPQKSGFGSHSHNGSNHQQRNSFRNRNGGPHPRGDGSHHHSYGGMRDQDRVNQDWNAHRHFSGRDAHVHLQRVAPRFIAPPNSAAFMPPSSVRHFGSPIGFPEMATPVYFVATPPPVSLRGGVPFLAPMTPHAAFSHAPVLEMHGKIVSQIDYYFSNDNLVKDTYLRQNMDEQGWVPIKLLAGFKQVKLLTENVQLIADAVRASTLVEVQGDKVRRRNDWMRWIIPPTFQFSNRQATRASKPDMLATGFQGLNLEEKVAYNNSSPRGEADFKCGELNRPADLHSNEEAGESSVPSIKKLK